MTLYRCELLFNSGQRGWSEKYCRNADTPKLASNFNAIALNRLMNFRSVNAFLYAIRASNPYIPGDEYLRVFNLSGARSGGDNDAGPDVYSTAALIRTISLNNHKGNMYVRGLEDRDTHIEGNTGRSVPSDFLRDAFLQWQEYLQSDASFGMEVPVPATTPGYFWSQIVSVAPDPNNMARSILTLADDLANVTVPPGVGAPAGIIIRGINQQVLPALQGVFRVVAADHANKKFSIYYTWRSNQQSVQPTRAYARPWQPQLSAFSEWAFQRFVSRKTGGPTIRSRGRRHAAVSRR